jgi:hypothetical protein
LTKNFSSWDLGHDGLLSSNERNKLVGAAEVHGEDAAAVAALKRASRSRVAKLPTSGTAYEIAPTHFN